MQSSLQVTEYIDADPDLQATPIVYCNDTVPGPHTSVGNRIVLDLTFDDSSYGKGFDINYEMNVTSEGMSHDSLTRETCC